MPDIILTCDRCFQEFRAQEYFSIHGHSRISVGAYRLLDPETLEPTIWAKFGHGMEETLCRGCMWSDEKFLEDYPWMRNPKLRALIIAKE